ncbi:MAG: amidohydrolase family protein, partial [Bacillota bacterium]
IGGNCGFGVGGFRKNTEYTDKICNNPFKSSALEIGWSTMNEYFGMLSQKGIPVNFANLAGHGSVRTSIKGYDPSPMTREEMEELLELLCEAMDDGAKGVSIGLQYEPGIFSTMDELKEVAKLVKKRNKILTTHSKASSALSGTYPIKPFGTPHNILALKDMIDLAKETGVRLQYSHLIFVGEKTWKTCDETMNILDKAISEGVDIKFDTYAYTCGASIISVILPEWFMAKVPKAYDSKADLKRLQMELGVIKGLLGFGYEDIQIAYIDHPELMKYNGRFISDIADELNLSMFDTFMLFVKSSNGKARVMQYRYANQHIIEKLMKHPASIFMTDAWVERGGAQNPACYGCFPRFLQIAREKKFLSLEETVYKMTKAAADRFEITDRGVLKKGCAADITVFDWNSVRDNTNSMNTDASPTGVEHVFINGCWVLKDGYINDKQRAGELLK